MAWAYVSTDVEVKRRGRVHDDLEAGGLDDVVKGAGAGNVGHEDRLEAVPGKARVGLVDLVGLVLRAHGGDDRVAAGEERLEDVGCLLLINIKSTCRARGEEGLLGAGAHRR